MRYSYIANGILGLGLIGTSILSVNQYNEIKSNQQQIKQLDELIVKKDNKIDQLNTINTTYEKAIEDYKKQVNKYKINIENKDKRINKLNKKLHNVESELHNKKLKLKRESSVRQGKVAIKSTSSQSILNNSINMIVTAYTPYCAGCSGKTSTGKNVRNTITHNGMRIIATDPNVIPLYSIVQIDLKNGQSFKAISLDTGGAIKGNKIDFLMSYTSEANNFGVQQAKVTILRKGK